jgi:hypothetical protein
MTKQARRVQWRIEVSRAIIWWIDHQIEKGRTDEQIEAALPAAVAFIKAGGPPA